MAKVLINESQYKSLIKYIRENEGVDQNSQAIVNDILGSLNEANFDGILNKVKEYATKGLITSVVLSALMATPKLTTAQKQQVKNIVATSQSQTNKVDSSKSNTSQVKLMSEWNKFILWLREKGLSGNSKLNNVEFSKSVMAEYKKLHPEVSLDYSDVIRVQKAIRAYRDYCIDGFKNNPDKFKKADNIKPDYSNFMSWVLGTKDDGLLGPYTSQFIFPFTYIKDLDKGDVENKGYNPAINVN